MSMKQNDVSKPLEEIKRGPEKQIITKRKDGKKRITPAFIGGLTASTPKPFGSKEFTFPKLNESKDDTEARDNKICVIRISKNFLHRF